MKILIAGCGYVGTALGESLAASGSRVWGLRRSPEGLAARGIEPIQADLEASESLRALPETDAVVLCQGISRDTDTYPGVYGRGTSNLLAAVRGKTRKVLSISSTSVYSTQDGSWVDEATDPGAGRYAHGETGAQAQALLSAEAAVLTSGIPATVFRLAGIYGPGRNRLRALKEGKIRPSHLLTYMNRIHRDDIVAGIRLLLEKGKAGEVYLGVDDYPSPQREFYGWICSRLGVPFDADDAPPPAAGRHSVNDKRCSNKKIKALGLVLKYPDYKAGYEPLLKELA